MLYEFNQETPKEIMARLAGNAKRRRLEKGYSREFLASASGVPAPTIARFEQKHAISLESFVKLAQTLGYNDSLKSLLSEPVYTTMSELETINRNKNRLRGSQK